MSQNSSSISFSDFSKATSDAASAIASGWSEAANRYTEWVAVESASRVVSETEKFERLATDLGTGLRNAEANAATWAQAARDASKTGIADIMGKYAEKFAAQANTLLGNLTDGKASLNLIAAEARTAMATAENAFGGGFGKAIDPAFDAYL